MPIGTTRKPQTLTRKNATPASSILRQPLGGFAPDTASYMEYMPQRMGAPVPTTSPLSQGFSQAPSPQGLMGLINNINGLVAQSQQQFQAGRNQSPVNWRYPTQSPLVRSPVANRQSMLAGQASTITGMQQAEKAGQGWMLTGNRGDMPTFVARNRPEDVMAEFVATHMDGLRDKALSRVPSGPLTLRTPGGQLQQQMGYIDGQGQKTATNRLGALRQLAMQNPNDADVMGALAAAENDFKAQMADRNSPAVVAANKEKIGARNDAKRGRAQRQAEGLRNLFGRGPQSPLARRQMPEQQSAKTPDNPFTSGTQAPQSAPSSPLTKSAPVSVSPDNRAAAKAFLKTVSQGGMSPSGTEVPPSEFIKATGVTGDEDNIQDFHFGLQQQVQSGVEPSVSDLRVLRTYAQAMDAAHRSDSYDPFDMTYGFEGLSSVDREHTDVFSPMYRDLIGMKDPSDKQLQDWWSGFRSRIRPDTNRFYGGSSILTGESGSVVSPGGHEYPAYPQRPQQAGDFRRNFPTFGPF